MKKTSYEIGADYSAWENLVHEMFIDENGEAREPTDEDKKYLEKCLMEIKDDAETKFDNMGKLISNLEIEADLIKAEKDVFYAETERLRKKITTCENKVKSVKSVATYLLDKLKLKKIKTTLFSFNIQNTQKSVSEYKGFFNPDLIPTQYLDRSISPSKVKDAIKKGELYEKIKINSVTNEETIDPENRGKLFYMENGVETELKFVSYTGGQALIIR